jgi:hypothetical protein
MKPSVRYHKKIFALCGTAGVLLAVYLITLFFDPERAAGRAAAFTWLPDGARDLASRVEITRPAAEKLVLSRNNGLWFAESGTGQVPVKQGRVDDLFRLLGTRGVFPRLGSSASSHTELGLSVDRASRLVIRGGAAVEPLLDLLIGVDDRSGKSVYLRKSGENEYRSGDNLIKTYVEGETSSWYNLKLFEENRSGAVQSLRVSPPKSEGEDEEDFTLFRNGASWVFQGGVSGPQADAVNSWMQNIFDIQAEAFLPRAEASGLEFNAGRLNLELGDGSALVVQAAGEYNGKRPVTVSGSSYIYLLSENAARRLFRSRSSLTQ